MLFLDARLLHCKFTSGIRQYSEYAENFQKIGKIDSSGCWMNCHWTELMWFVTLCIGSCCWHGPYWGWCLRQCEQMRSLISEANWVTSWQQKVETKVSGKLSCHNACPVGGWFADGFSNFLSTVKCDALFVRVIFLRFRSRLLRGTKHLCVGVKQLSGDWLSCHCLWGMREQNFSTALHQLAGFRFPIISVLIVNVSTGQLELWYMWRKQWTMLLCSK